MNRILLAALAAVAMLGAGPALAAQFDHATHNTYLDPVDCATCHVAGAPSISPDQKVCLECHEQGFVDEVSFPGLKTHGVTWPLTHRPFAKGNTYDCAACHQQSDCLECHKSGFADEQGSFSNSMLNVHRSDFHVTHPLAARTEPQLCSSCHEPSFCSDCHDNFNRNDLALASHRRGFTDGTLDGAHAGFDDSQCQTCHPNSVLPTHQWSGQHAREARKNLATCQSCHPEGDICLKCHSARSGLMVNPHPGDWDDFKGRLDRASGGKTCRRCH
ncbi:c-type cytochrome [Desulfuromonas versatilis]|uniref:C-type cytochrome n=1 Tax=Desulfuromonas versatilis TaxID=2802975 RepID=A0ABM8HV21_9BACT|nr:cytochrome C [Desulfuromonas versatilis]BCR06773.1 c-type cytochrome [Desulfuromonas versatilis]